MLGLAGSTLAKFTKKVGTARNYFGAELKDHGMDEAEKILRIGLETTGLEADVLDTLPKGLPEKAIIAREIRKRTSAPLAWIADRLEMGTTPNIRRAVLSLEETLKKSAPLRKKNRAFLKRIEDKE